MKSSFFTQKTKSSSGAATPEIANIVKARFVSVQEPDIGQPLNCETMKEVTGKDKITYRDLYKGTHEVILQAVFHFMCNSLPMVPTDDEGTWRRMNVIPYTSRFCKNPDPKNPNEYLIDYNLSDKIKQWDKPFLYILIQYYKDYLKNGLHTPQCVIDAISKYRHGVDEIREFLDESYDFDGQSLIEASRMIKGYKLKDHKIKDKEFREYFEKRDQLVKVRGVYNIKGYIPKSTENQIEDEKPSNQLQTDI